MASQGAKSTAKISTMQEMAPARYGKHVYITGLRGIFVIESFVWVYFSTFIPGIVPQHQQSAEPSYQIVLRDVFGVLFWNGSLIWNAFIILSMRTIAISYLETPTGQVYAATVIRRIARMVIILCAASGIATLIYSQTGTQDIQRFIDTLPNYSIIAPAKTYDGLSAVNSLFNLFWLNTDFYSQAANNFWPTHTLWVSAVIYYQSWTVYFLMVFLPFTRPKWHIQGLFLFALGSFWMESWGWYSATGLFFADLAMNNTIQGSFERGIRIVKDDWRVPYWSLAVILGAAGIALKYFVTILPQYSDSELVVHPYLDLSNTYSPATTVASGPYPRLDDWLVITAILIIIESFDGIKQALSIRPLVWLGERSFSIFAAQSIIFWTAGTKLWLVLHQQSHLNTASANAIVLLIGVIATAAFSEAFYRLIDLPSRFAAKHLYSWLID